MRSFLIVPICWLVFSHPVAKAQQPAATLDWPAFRQQVLANHPRARQADLRRDLAAADLLRAKGGFDPKAYAELSAKEFGDKNYYRYGEAGLKWPGWAGLELKGAYTWAGGEYLNPERRLPEAGQAVLGLEWALGQGLLFDDRRAALYQSRIGLEQGEAERSGLANDLLFEAAKTYWTWVAAENQVAVFAAALEQARLRLEGLRESFRQGDKAAIDTTEALIQVQTRLLDLNFAQLDRQQAGLSLNAFLWQTDQQPVAPDRVPAAPALTDIAGAPAFDVEALIQEARQRHPELRAYDAKIRSLEVERRLKNEKRKPELDLTYNLLGSGWTFFPTATASDGVGLLANDIKWGVQFSYPILNRKARGDWQLTEIKLTQTEMALRQKRQEVEIKLRQYAGELANFERQLPLLRDFTANYKLLLDAEIEKFRQGESSVFLINAREQRWLDARLKYLKLLSEFRKAEAGLRWAAGTLADF
jgi:outer membrane protein TolC